MPINTTFLGIVKICKIIWFCKFLCLSVGFGCDFVFLVVFHHVFVLGLPVWIFFSIFA